MSTPESFMNDLQAADTNSTDVKARLVMKINSHTMHRFFMNSSQKTQLLRVSKLLEYTDSKAW